MESQALRFKKQENRTSPNTICFWDLNGVSGLEERKTSQCFAYTQWDWVCVCDSLSVWCKAQRKKKEKKKRVNCKLTPSGHFGVIKQKFADAFVGFIFITFSLFEDSNCTRLKQKDRKETEDPCYSDG